ncbi:hypothetical protein SAMN05660226_03152 [Parapedobacter luteus]|uniref:Uncharacterized protein n=1 Tax=Parapedobacter luteus TaxID=623280 RepID=A0A1T5E4J1_9SPHI|nr:hypothetical protein SAMN05660226_03152 [Parapedobacter luteus]
MLARLVYFLVIVAYINTIFYQDGHIHGDNSYQVIDGTPLVEVILEDVLDIPCAGEESEQDNDFQYDDYRPASSKWISVPVPRGNAELNPPPIVDIFDQRLRLGLNTKISHLIGYYRFLFRLKPF